MTLSYKFPEVKPRKAQLGRSVLKPEKPLEPLVLGPIQGRQAGSREEWRLAMALNERRIPFRYQVSVYGGRRVRGGQVIDFVVFMPYAQPVQVYGAYYHRNYQSGEEAFAVRRIEQLYHRPVVIIWDYELESIEEARQAVRRKLA
jgi:hypothetical protein